MKYIIDYTSSFKKQHKKLQKQGKDLNKLYEVIKTLSNGKQLDKKYKNNKLKNNNVFKNCYECHIEPDWLLIYKIEKEILVIILFATGSHSDLFNK